MNKKVFKTIFGFIAVIAIAAVAGINVNISTNDISKNLSELAATNLEALADNESSLNPIYKKTTSDCSVVIEGQAGIL